jgi:4-amino-4-deoxy-L-arabinose transferase-like glycosyltransferase
MVSIAVRESRFARLPAGASLAPLAVVLLVCLAVAINPVGYIGSGNDDQQYLLAARCWVAAGGPCLAETHWASRWPVVAPLAAFIGTFGESRTSVGLAPLFYWAAALVSLWVVGSRWFGRSAGLIAVLLLGLTPVFAAAALQPSADNPELAFQLAALAAATVAFERQGRGWAIAAGVLAALALQVRDTSIVFVGVSALAWLLLDPQRRKVLLWAIPGLLGAAVAEMAAYAAAAGDPLYRYKLALGHVGIPSAELASWVDTSRSPIFNPDYVAGWKREAGIELFWPADPWLNLLASARLNMTLFASIATAILFARLIGSAERRRAKLVAGLALLVAGLLVYGLAVDPKTRMFLSLAAGLSLVSGAMLAKALEGTGRAAAWTLIAVVAAYQLNALAHYPASYEGEAKAREWIARYPGQIEVDGAARGYLELLPEARGLARAGSGRPLRIATTLGPCEALLDGSDGAKLIDWSGGDGPGQGRICLFRYGAERR